MSGPVLGGLLLSLYDWRAIFILRLPLAILALFLAARWIAEAPRRPLASRRLDLPGALTLLAGLSSLLVAVNRGRVWGWSSAETLLLLLAGLASLLAFVWIEGRTPSPVLSLALFRLRRFTCALLSLALNFGGQAAIGLIMPFYLLNVRGFSTAHAGLLLVTLPLMMLTLSPLSGYLSDRFGFRYQMVAGAALVTLGIGSLATLGAETATPLIVLRLAVVGIGTALFMAPNSSALMGSVEPAMLGAASGSMATARNLGNATGLALAGAVLSGVAAAGGQTPAHLVPLETLLRGIHAAFAAAAAVSLLAIVATVAGSRGGRPDRLAPATQPPERESAAAVSG
jgi:MFS family permease